MSNFTKGLLCSEDKNPGDTHEDLLVDVKDIEKECTEHYPDPTNKDDIRCAGCNKKIKVKWEVV